MPLPDWFWTDDPKPQPKGWDQDKIVPPVIDDDWKQQWGSSASGTHPG